MTTPECTALLLLNTGSPDAPEASAVRRYLAEFLSDERVIELPKWKWWPILHGIILRVRPAKSAERYRGVWTEDGSPLLVHTKSIAEKLGRRLEGEGISVHWASCYGNPSIPAVLTDLEKAGVERLVVLPLFPQYAPQTTASAFDAVFRHLMTRRSQPALTTVREYGAHPAYIEALARRIEAHWEKTGRPFAEGGKLLMSFHGLPKSCIAKGDRYEEDCRKTAALLAERLGLKENEWLLAFQSRFGKEEWLTPYTEPTLRELGKAGVPRVDVVCPGFASDCLETIEEIDDEARRAYEESAENGRFEYIPALNDCDDAVALYARLALEALGRKA
ncbi:MAG TPA: ferrochelatase [Candidatus Sutterella merdavium]|nr:ferrochelatase [Candidatus Sutterella merdavium]